MKITFLNVILLFIVLSVEIDDLYGTPLKIKIIQKVGDDCCDDPDEDDSANTSEKLTTTTTTTTTTEEPITTAEDKKTTNESTAEEPTTTTTTRRRTTTTTTTIPPTTSAHCPDKSTSESLQWINVGSDDFVRFAQYESWECARLLCQDHSLDLYHPINVTAVALYLEDSYSAYGYWLGGKFVGSSMMWVDGAGVARDEPWRSDYHYYDVGPGLCLIAQTCCGDPEAGTILYAYSCTATRPFLCGHGRPSSRRHQ